MHRLEDVFPLMDTDANGSISYDEVMDFITASIPSTSPEEIKARFEKADADGSGEIDRGEFEGLVREISTVSSRSMEDMVIGFKRMSYQNLFDLVDFDCSGSLSRREVERLFEVLPVTATMNEIRAATDECDVDRSGSLDAEEFSEILNRFTPGVPISQIMMAFYKAQVRARQQWKKAREAYLGKDDEDDIIKGVGWRSRTATHEGGTNGNGAVIDNNCQVPQENQENQENQEDVSPEVGCDAQQGQENGACPRCDELDKVIAGLRDMVSSLQREKAALESSLTAALHSEPPPAPPTPTPQDDTEKRELRNRIKVLEAELEVRKSLGFIAPAASAAPTSPPASPSPPSGKTRERAERASTASSSSSPRRIPISTHPMMSPTCYVSHVEYMTSSPSRKSRRPHP